MSPAQDDATSNWAQQDLKCVALPDGAIIPGHKYANFEHVKGNLAKGRMKHIQKDVELLTADLPDNIFVRYAEDRPDFMKILIAGTEGTPYAYGLFEFDLYCSLEYPLKPPNLTFRTTGKSPLSRSKKKEKNLPDWCANQAATHSDSTPISTPTATSVFLSLAHGVNLAGSRTRVLYSVSCRFSRLVYLTRSLLVTSQPGCSAKVSQKAWSTICSCME